MLKDIAAKGAMQQLLPLLGIGLLLLLIVAAAAGLWTGNRWAEGAQAIKDRKRDRNYIEQLQADAEQLRQIAADAALDYAAAADRMDAFATQLEKDREANRKHQQTQRAELEKLLRDRPDLRDGRAGDDVLQHWNRSNKGATTDGPAARAGSQPDDGVSGVAAGNVGSVGSTAGESRPSRRALSRLQSGQVAPDSSGAGLGAHGLAVVLPVTGADAVAGLPQ